MVVENFCGREEIIPVSVIPVIVIAIVVTYTQTQTNGTYMIIRVIGPIQKFSSNMKN